MALCDSAGSVDQDFASYRSISSPAPGDPFSSHQFVQGLFTPEFLSNLSSVANRTAQAMGEDCLTSCFGSLDLHTPDLFDNPDKDCLTSTVYSEHLRSTARQYVDFVYPTEPPASATDYTFLEALTAGVLFLGWLPPDALYP